LKSAQYDQATVAYNAEDYPQALKGYYQCLKEDWSSFAPGDAGLIYHRIGNCLIKMRNFKEASVSYQKALQDDAYSEKTSIYVNLGTTLNGIGKHAEAITYFNRALADASYATPYRAFMGLGSAYSKLRKFVEAGTAYRDAALDESNPNPVKALLSLATTFTELGRPNDAVETYLAILDFRVTGRTLNTTLERLGRAYVAAGRYQEGIETFEDIRTRERFTLTPEAEEDYEKAQRALGLFVKSPSSEEQAVIEDTPLVGFEPREQYSLDSSAPFPPYEFNEEEGYGGGNVPHSGNTGFFTATDDDLIATSKRNLRRERKLRNTGPKILLVIVLILIIALGTCVLAYTQGIGFPSQETTVTDFFADYSAGNPIEDYWVADSGKDGVTLDRILDGVARSSEVTIVGMQSQMTESQVLVDLKLSEGGLMHYRIDLARDLIGWKIRGIELVFAPYEL
jgi:tetratricopeptide (TPR) repeat protein